MSGSPEWFLGFETHLTGAKAKVALRAVGDGRDFAAAADAPAPFAQELPDK
jgi:hypothetical protein